MSTASSYPNSGHSNSDTVLNAGVTKTEKAKTSFPWSTVGHVALGVGGALAGRALLASVLAGGAPLLIGTALLTGTLSYALSHGKANEMADAAIAEKYTQRDNLTLEDVKLIEDEKKSIRSKYIWNNVVKGQIGLWTTMLLGPAASWAAGMAGGAATGFYSGLTTATKPGQHKIWEASKGMAVGALSGFAFGELFQGVNEAFGMTTTSNLTNNPEPVIIRDCSEGTEALTGQGGPLLADAPEQPITFAAPGSDGSLCDEPRDLSALIKDLDTSNASPQVLKTIEAAQAGNAQAVKDLGYFVNNGFGGMKTDHELAYELFSNAAENGNSQGIRDKAFMTVNHEYYGLDECVSADEESARQVLKNFAPAPAAAETAAAAPAEPTPAPKQPQQLDAKAEAVNFMAQATETTAPAEPEAPVAATPAPDKPPEARLIQETVTPGQAYFHQDLGHTAGNSSSYGQERTNTYIEYDNGQRQVLQQEFNPQAVNSNTTYNYYDIDAGETSGVANQYGQQMTRQEMHIEQYQDPKTGEWMLKVPLDQNNRPVFAPQSF